MRDVLRTLLLAGVGAIDLTDGKVRSIIDELIRRGELAADDARELTALWAAGARDRREAIADRVRRAVDEALKGRTSPRPGAWPLPRLASCSVADGTWA